jgi:hypothetical protein
MVFVRIKTFIFFRVHIILLVGLELELIIILFVLRFKMLYFLYATIAANSTFNGHFITIHNVSNKHSKKDEFVKRCIELKTKLKYYILRDQIESMLYSLRDQFS